MKNFKIADYIEQQLKKYEVPQAAIDQIISNAKETNLKLPLITTRGLNTGARLAVRLGLYQRYINPEKQFNMAQKLRKTPSGYYLVAPSVSILSVESMSDETIVLHLKSKGWYNIDWLKIKQL